jgi:hypothetical protein
LPLKQNLNHFTIAIYFSADRLWRKIMRMKRTNIYLTKVQYEQVNTEAQTKEITFSEMFRRIIDQYLEKNE